LGASVAVTRWAPRIPSSGNRLEINDSTPRSYGRKAQFLATAGPQASYFKCSPSGTKQIVRAFCGRLEVSPSCRLPAAKSAAVQEIDVPCTQGGCNVQNPK